MTFSALGMLIAALMIAVAIYFATRKPHKPSPPVTKTVGMYGDSITKGDGLDPSPTVRMTQMAQGAWTGIDYALGGSTVMDAVAGTDPRMPFGPWAQQMKIDTSLLIVIGYAGATALRHPDKIDEYERLLEEMIDQAEEQGKIVILRGMSHVPALIQGENEVDSDRLNKALANFDGRTRWIAVRLGLRFVDLRMLPFAGQSDLMDKVHPNQAYSDRISALVVAAINTALNDGETRRKVNEGTGA